MGTLACSKGGSMGTLLDSFNLKCTLVSFTKDHSLGLCLSLAINR